MGHDLIDHISCVRVVCNNSARGMTVYSKITTNISQYTLTTYLLGSILIITKVADLSHCLDD